MHRRERLGFPSSVTTRAYAFSRIRTGLAEAADRTLAAVAAALPGSRQVINDRGWASFQFLMFPANPLDYPSSEVVHQWGEKRPWSQVPSFTS